MIERKFVAERMKEHQIHEYICKNLKRVDHSHTKLLRTPLGEKIIIYAARPGLIVGRQGQNIKKLTSILKNKFKLENPQIEINEVENISLDAQIVAERIANSLERFGSKNFKGIGHRVMGDVMNNGALGIEIIISGKIPSTRSKSWRFYQGYLKKCGDIALSVRKSYTRAELKTGTVGIKVKIMPPDIKLPDRISFIDKKEEIIEEIKEDSEKDVNDKKEKTTQQKTKKSQSKKETKLKKKKNKKIEKKE